MSEIIIPKVPELYDVRKSVSRICGSIPDHVVGVKGVYLLERSEQRWDMEDCAKYVFPAAPNANVEARRVKNEHSKCGFTARALAYYLDDKIY